MRRRPAPLAAVVVLAALPAVGLAGLWRWADGLDALPEVDEVPVAPVTGPPAPVLTTPLASLRRTPEPLAERLAEVVFTETVAAALDDVGPGSCAAVTRSGVPIASVADDVAVIPASNQKLLVASVALEVLGVDTTLRTEVRTEPPVEGVITGDLYLVGGGDPVLRSAEIPPGRPFEVVTPTRFESLVEQLVDAGITRVEGEVVADGSRYDDEFVVPSWGPDITRGDAGPIGGLVVNDGVIFGAGVGLNPAQSAANELSRLLRAAGITIVGGNRTGTAPAELDVVATVESAPIGTLVAEVLVTSNNQIAEMLLKEIGWVEVGQGSRTAGLDAIRARLELRGVDLAGALLDDGSGLSRANALRCPTLTDLLATEPGDGPLATTLPLMGEEGTLAGVMVDTPAAGTVRAKTGTLTGVKALSGYAPAGLDDRFEFAIVLNGDGVEDPAVHLPRWAALLAALDEYPVTVEIEPLGPR